MRSDRVCLALLLFSCVTLAAQTAASAPDPIERRIVHFHSDGINFPGSLTLPHERTGKVAMVVLVGGSGVQDRDETVGPNKPFADIATGLAEHGIASLRYDRRPIVAPQSFEAHMDLDHEVVIDAVAALGYCSALPEVDAHRIYLLGHSLGAQLAPDIVKARLAQSAGSVAGMILMAGVAQRLDVAIYAQIRTLGKAQGGTQTEIDVLVAQWDAVFSKAKDLSVPGSEPITVGGTTLPVMYWRDWLRRDPVATMKTLHVPTLVLHGTHDVNSTEKDFEMLSQAGPASQMTAKDYAGLNHLFMPTNDMGNGYDELTAGHVAPEVIGDIAAWIELP